jgi:hypothetical protein
MLDRELPGLDDDRDTPLFEAFDKCAIAMLECLGDAPTAMEASRQASLVPHAEGLLTRVFFRFLCISATDDDLLVSDPEEYANRSSEEYKLSLTCPHGAARIMECQRCAHLEGGVSTSRSAAMAATRELIKLATEASANAFLQFIGKHLATPITGSAEDQRAKMAIRGGTLRAFAAVADRLGQSAVHHNSAASTEVLRIIRTVLIPETAREPSIPFAAHLRSIACTVLERFIEYLSKQQQNADLVRGVQAIMTCLADPMQAVRAHALNSLDEMVKWRDGLKENLAAIATDAMGWLAGLLADERRAGTTEIMAALMSFLYSFPGKLGAVPLNHPKYGDPAFREACLIKAHGDLFATLARRFHVLAESAVADRAGSTELRLISCLIETIHALILAAPRDMLYPRAIHAKLLPLLVPYVCEILDPRVLSIASRYGKAAEATDVIGMLPPHNSELWTMLLQRVHQTVVQTPAHAELLVPVVCEFLHLGDGRQYLFEGGGCLRVMEMARLCLSGEVPVVVRGVDLLRSAALMSSKQPDDPPPRDEVWSYWKLLSTGHSPPAAATQARAALVAMLFGTLHPAMEAIAADPGVRGPVCAKLVCAACAALYIDPLGCLPLLGQTVGSTTMMQHLVTFFDCYTSLINHTREIDLALCSMGLSALVHVLVLRKVPLSSLAPILKSITVFVHQLNDIEGAGGPQPHDAIFQGGGAQGFSELGGGAGGGGVEYEHSDDEEDEEDEFEHGDGEEEDDYEDEEENYTHYVDDADSQFEEFYPDLFYQFPDDSGEVFRRLIVALTQQGLTQPQLQQLLGVNHWEILKNLHQFRSWFAP